MKIGLIARSDHRGLGLQSVEFFRHMDPHRTVVVDMGPLSPYDNHPEDFPGADVVPFIPGAELPFEVMKMIREVDVVWGAETLYWDDLIPFARRCGTKTVVTANWEFFRWAADPELPRPDLFLAPSKWHLEDWPPGTIHLPFPVARDRLPFRARAEARTFLHIAGHRAMQDRAGTRLILTASRYIRSGARIVIRSQTTLPGYRQLRNIEVRNGDVANYWDLYEGDVLLHPRRYGGLSLPLNEAQSLGMPVIALDREPERSLLPEESVMPARRARDMKVISGHVGWYDADPRQLARKIDELARDDALVTRMSKEADEYAESISWERLAPTYRGVFSKL